MNKQHFHFSPKDLTADFKEVRSARCIPPVDERVYYEYVCIKHTQPHIAAATQAGQGYRSSMKQHPLQYISMPRVAQSVSLASRTCSSVLGMRTYQSVPTQG